MEKLTDRELIEQLVNYVRDGQAKLLGTHTRKELIQLAQRRLMWDDRPLDMVLHCPHCKTQHIDRVGPVPRAWEEGKTQWLNPPHKKHLCLVEDGGCGLVWQPADVTTNGVEKLASHVCLHPAKRTLKQGGQWCPDCGEFFND